MYAESINMIPVSLTISTVSNSPIPAGTPTKNVHNKFKINWLKDQEKQVHGQHRQRTK